MSSFARCMRKARLVGLSGIVLFGLVGWGLGCNDSGADPAARAGGERVGAPQTRLRVRTELVRRASLSGVDRVTGTVRAFHRADLTAETSGRVVIRGVEAGAAVEEGDPILELEAARQQLALRRAEAALEAARTVLTHAERELARGERLARASALSEQRRDDLQHAVDRARDELALARVARDTAKRDLEDTRIRAPFAGLVDSVVVDIGDYVRLGEPVATLVDLSRVRIFAGVTAGEAARLERGLTARVSFADLGGRRFDATLMSVGRVASAGEGTYPIELWLEDADAAMRDGLVARIDLPDPSQEQVLLVPRTALLRRDGRPEAFVVQEEEGLSVARARAIRTGRNEGQWVEILDGLAEGDAVVVDGLFALENGSIVVVDGAPSTGAASARVPASPDAAVAGEQ